MSSNTHSRHSKSDGFSEHRFDLLIQAYLDGTLDRAQADILKHYLADCRYVARFIERIKQEQLMHDLIASGSVQNESFSDSFDHPVWKELAEYEAYAPAVCRQEATPDRIVVQKVEHPPTSRKVSRSTILSLLTSAAAIVFLVLFARYAPPKSGIQVATLQDSLGAKWADTNLPMRGGMRFKTGSDIWTLREGIAALVFDNNTQVVMEGPAEFQILTSDQIKLNYGRLYAIVPPEGYGFQVTTPDAKIIDLGTEFGVQQDMHGNTELHVVKGKTSLVSGIRGNRINAYVEAGAAKRLDAGTGHIENITCNEQLFVRRIDSGTNFVWRGQTTLDLADMVGLGNGLGAGRATARIHPTKGYTDDQNVRIYAPSSDYLPLPSNPFVDGVFVPDGRADQVISTQGDTFDETPETSGLYSVDLVANPRPGLFLTNLRQGTIQFDGQIYGDGHRPCIVMHTNIGLTFDLEAIRRFYKRDITAFTSKIGIADLHEPYPCNADFWVLVDGQVRYSLQQYKEKGVLTDIRIEINPTDRFLTLVTTDGGDDDDPASFYTRAISCDWCVFAEPELMLE